jgi:hypothetical protein
MLDKRFRFALATAVLAAGVSHAQSQPQNNYVRDYCVKVEPGKSGDFAAYVREVTPKLMQARVDAGEAAWGLVAEVIAPEGSTAPCDYHIVYGFRGSLPEPSTDPSGMEAAIKRAGLTMSRQELLARRDSLSHLVRLEVLRNIDGVGGETVKGGYLRINHYRTKAGQSVNSWAEIEKTVWKPLVIAHREAGGKSSWGAYQVIMPTGDMVWSNGLTVDSFPNWASMMEGIKLSELWPKVHPNRSMAEWSDRLSTIVDRRLVEVARVTEMVVPKTTAAGSN